MRGLQVSNSRCVVVSCEQMARDSAECRLSAVCCSRPSRGGYTLGTRPIRSPKIASLFRQRKSSTAKIRVSSPQWGLVHRGLGEGFRPSYCFAPFLPSARSIRIQYYYISYLHGNLLVTPLVVNRSHEPAVHFQRILRSLNPNHFPLTSLFFLRFFGGKLRLTPLLPPTSKKFARKSFVSPTYAKTGGTPLHWYDQSSHFGNLPARSPLSGSLNCEL